MGHAKHTGHSQIQFQKTGWQHRFSHGGTLRRKRRGRRQRPLSTKEPLHLVFKVHRSRLKSQSLRSAQCHSLILKILRRYSRMFWIKVEQVSIQGDHCHLLIRAPKRSKFHDFFRVFAGQIAQQFEREGLLKTARKSAGTGTPSGSQEGTGLWQHRPFSRVVRGYRAYLTVRNYIQLNEKEAQGKISYQKRRLGGLSTCDWEELWKLCCSGNCAENAVLCHSSVAGSLSVPGPKLMHWNELRNIANLIF